MISVFAKRCSVRCHFRFTPPRQIITAGILLLVIQDGVDYASYYTDHMGRTFDRVVALLSITLQKHFNLGDKTRYRLEAIMAGFFVEETAVEATC